MDYRDFIVLMADEEVIDVRDILIMCLKYMSVDAIKDMISINELDGVFDWYLELNDEYELSGEKL